MGAWRPLDPKDPDYSYYKSAPAWHMYGHPGRPTKEQILEARDRMVARNPGLRVIGCHLGSMEEDVDDVAKRLDRYPNFAVDTAARVLHLAVQDREKVRAFLIRYQDRVLYATDLVAQPWDNPEATAKRWAAEYERDWRYFATSEPVEFDGRKVAGLDLPKLVLEKIFHDNAVRWVPGIK
jgi:predicted TIM-barrel fold metal-dependent hydrolase